MTKTQMNPFRRALEARRLELRADIRNRGAISIENNADTLDQIQSASEREFALRTLERDSVAARQVQSALDRIKNGTFGVCLDCGEEINPKRLAAVPWATACIHCQEQADRSLEEEGLAGESPSRSMPFEAMGLPSD